MRRPRLRRVDRFADADYVQALERYADQLEGALKTARRNYADCLRKLGAALRAARTSKR